MAFAGRKVLARHFARMLKNESGTCLGEDIEALHKMRVATRRMRAALRIFGQYFQPETERMLRKGLKATGKALGRVRDWDVLLEKTRVYQGTQSLAEGDDQVLLVAFWSHKRLLARAKMLRYLDGDAYTRFKRDFTAFLNLPQTDLLSDDLPTSPVYQVAPGIIETCYQTVLSHQQLMHDPTVEQLHTLRIDFKRLRYTLEFFRSTLDDPVVNCIQQIKHVQDHLGDLNDASVALQRLQPLLAPTNNPLSDTVFVQAYYAARQKELADLVHTFEPVWIDFNRPEFRTNLDQSLRPLQ